MSETLRVPSRVRLECLLEEEWGVSLAPSEDPVEVVACLLRSLEQEEQEARKKAGEYLDNWSEQAARASHLQAAIFMFCWRSDRWPCPECGRESPEEPSGKVKIVREDGSQSVRSCWICMVADPLLKAVGADAIRLYNAVGTAGGDSIEPKRTTA